MIAPLWDDFDAESGNVYHGTVGTAPNRQFVVQWHNRVHFNGTSNTDGATFEVVFDEATGAVSFQYLDVQYTAMEMWKKHLNYGTTLQLYLDAVDTPDANTAVFRYSRPMPLDLLLRALADLGYVAPKHVYEGTNVLENPANTAPIGTGPFKFVQYERGQYIIAERNPNYWRKGLPYLDRIVWRIIPEPAAAVAALMRSFMGQGHNGCFVLPPSR